MVGCGGGGGGLEVGAIKGPSSMAEYSSAQYNITVSGDSGIQYSWACDPGTAGSFSDPTTSTVAFEAAAVSADTPIQLIVAVASDNYDPEVKMRSIAVTDVFAVGEIVGPSSLSEFTSAVFSVTASGDTSIQYQWVCDPVSAGSFDDPTADTVTFEADSVDSDTDVQLTVTISGDNYGPEPKTLGITVTDNPMPAGTGWAKTWGGSLDDTGKAVVVDSSGSMYVAGRFQDTVDFDPGPNDAVHAAIGADVYMTRFDSDGEFQWVRTWGGGTVLNCTSITIDDSDNVFLQGYFLGTIDFDPGPATDVHASTSPGDVYIVKLDSSGAFQWANTWGGPGSTAGKDVATDSSGNLFVAGLFAQTVDFDPGIATLNYTSEGSSDAFLSKFDSTGAFQWVMTWGATEWDGCYGVGTDGADSIYVTGHFRSDPIDLDPSSGVEMHSQIGDYTVYLSKFSLSGELQWAHSWGATVTSYSNAISVGCCGIIYVTGDFAGTIDLDPDSATEDPHDSNGDYDSFLSRYDSSGDFHWGITWGGAGDDGTGAVALDGTRSVYVVGGFEGTVDFDPGAGEEFHDPIGSGDIYLSRFSPDGTFQWVRTWDAMYPFDGDGLAADEYGYAYLTGFFNDTVDFDPGPETEEHAPIGGLDAFLVKVLPNGNWEE